jgi:hypothetical protein
MSWTTSPPSDQPVNLYAMPSTVCSAGASMRRRVPATATTLVPAGLSTPSRLS